MSGRTEKKTTMATSKRVLPESDTPWSLMIISVGKSGEENQYQQWLERTASTAIDATGFLGTHIFQPYPGAREYIRQICFDSKGHLVTWAHSACTEIAGRDHEEFIEYCDIQPIETVADANSQPSVRRRTMEAISAHSGSRLSPDIDHFHADQRHLSLNSRR
jgi:heme-degrading monooxygenase HmoA